MTLDEFACCSRDGRRTVSRHQQNRIEGFLRLGKNPKLGGSGLVLATSSGLFKLIDSWLIGLPHEYFEQVLPLLRRTTSTFSTGERRQIAERVRTGASSVLFGGSDDQ